MKSLQVRRFMLFVGYLLSVHVLALLFFFILRWMLFVMTDYTFAPEITQDIWMQSVAFVKGLWFDNVIACYILIVPLAFCWMASFVGYAGRWLYRFCSVFFIVLYSVAFSIAAANIPYFAYFFKPINSSIFNWAEYVGATAGMIFGETSYYPAIGLGVGTIVLFAFIVWRMAGWFYMRSSEQSSPRTWFGFVQVLLSGAALVGLCVFGIRGRMGYNPIKVSQAYYCNDPFLNQLGVNPVFNLLTSVLDDNRKENRRLDLMEDDEAVKKAQHLLGRGDMDHISPLARKIEADSVAVRKNIVLILMESMSAKLMARYGNTKGLTPVLDSLHQRSLAFTNIYSAGIHTNHGMYATLYSFPAIMARNAMKGSVIPNYSGLPTVLKEYGYRNLFFMTHESQYDNMNAFFRTNGFDEIYAEEDYPSEKVVSGFGVQDDFLFEYALPVLNERAESGTPFFSVLLTISNHPPYIIPEDFQPRSKDLSDQIVEFADAEIGKFMAAAANQPWFDNTIFIFLGDHGKLVGTPESESPESYNHVPLMFYGKGIEPKEVDVLGGQVDVAPTLLGMLHMSHVQNHFGVDLLKEERPCMYYTADNLIAVRDTSHLYIYIPKTEQEIRYRKSGDGLHPDAESSRYDSLKIYGFSMLQTAEYMVEKGMTTVGP